MGCISFLPVCDNLPTVMFVILQHMLGNSVHADYVQFFQYHQTHDENYTLRDPDRQSLKRGGVTKSILTRYHHLRWTFQLVFRLATSYCFKLNNRAIKHVEISMEI